MAQVICDVETLGVLNMQTFPESLGGATNPFRDLNSFLISTQGHWKNKLSYPLGITGIQTAIASSGTPVPSEAFDLYITPKFPSSRLTFDLIDSACSLFNTDESFLEIVGWEAYIKISEENYSDEVPQYLPNSTVQNSEEPDAEPTARTWSSYKDSTHEHQNYEGSYYISTASCNNSACLSGNLISQLVADGFDIVTPSELQVIAAQES